MGFLPVILMGAYYCMCKILYRQFLPGVSALLYIEITAPVIVFRVCGWGRDGFRKSGGFRNIGFRNIARDGFRKNASCVVIVRERGEGRRG